jgi:tetratricopeptide (TPR) repeat protein
VSNLDNTLVKYVIKPLKFLQLYEEGLNYLASVLVYNSNSTLLNLEVELLSDLRMFEDAMEIAKFITSLNPECPENWLSLSIVYLKKKHYESCLRALNNIYFLKDFTNIEIYKSKSSESISYKESPLPKNKTFQVQIRFNEILVENKDTVDLSYGSTQFYMCENADVLYDTINKIMNCSYYKFDLNQRKAYNIVLEMIKEINFDAFVDLKRKLFFFNVYNNTETERSSTFRSEGIQTIANDMKISINPFLELVIDNLIEDLKIFSIVIAQDEMYFNTLFTKEDLSITEVKFCIAIGILSERLKYYNTALKFYTKALKFSFSKYVFIRKIKIFGKLKDYKNVMLHIVQFLSYIPSEQFKIINKTPHWIDKIMLRILYEFQINEIISWISDAGKHIIDFILKRVIQKYKYWIDVGQELHLIKS